MLGETFASMPPRVALAAGCVDNPPALFLVVLAGNRAGANASPLPVSWLTPALSCSAGGPDGLVPDHALSCFRIMDTFQPSSPVGAAGPGRQRATT
eukprot:4348532-Lingulodinium_polyedra.AAC.1